MVMFCGDKILCDVKYSHERITPFFLFYKPLNTLNHIKNEIHEIT